MTKPVYCPQQIVTLRMSRRNCVGDEVIAQWSKEKPLRCSRGVDRATTHCVGTPILGGWGMAPGATHRRAAFLSVEHQTEEAMQFRESY
jgi:hypothetical protein